MRRAALILVLLCAVGVAAPSAHAAFPGENGKLAFSHWADDDTWYAIYTVNPDNTELTRLGNGDEPEWSADGTKIAFYYQSQIWTMDADGGNRTQVTTTGGQDPAWSPSGDELVFVGPDFERDLMLINADGTDLRTIRTDGCHFSPDWSPSGTEIAVLGLCGGGGLVTVTPDGGTLRTIAVNVGGQVDWSPGEAWLTIGGGPGLGVVSAAGGPVAHIGGDPQSGMEAWSPDGSRMVYVAGDNGNTRQDAIYHVNLAGGDLVEVAPTMRRKWYPTWQPLPPGPSHPGYARPKGATPFRVPLVPAYAPCEDPDRMHGPPLAFDACMPPEQTSTTLTVGTPDANGQASRSMGTTQFNVLPGDVSIEFNMSDVRCRWAAGGCTGALSDYAASLQVTAIVRATDRWNIGAGLESATVTDFEAFNLPIRGFAECTPTADASVGSTCSLYTTVNALTPGAVRAGSRATWALGAVRIFDSGPDGEPTSDDNELFATQGLFVP